MIIDAWAQHPTLRHSQDPIFDSLRRWTTSKALTEPLPVMMTPAKALEGLDTLDLDAEARSLFLSGNAARVFGIS